ncbi:electron transport complex subunit RsxC [Thiospirochaeta perfilievii]|uniref:Ion-translocating oxidoreductase complex subunit C n=1 Tax=Thiospirochaeta perfilievii TaxID=252967 RepID=A0A5C1QAI0_9SPIO|nr:electron transport complex subunit RsxC [Thiospirochaeta perfilievii]QEN03806.1 electron transport complex subunit RsxC [Thiospirochaeta perfilievii]
MKLKSFPKGGIHPPHRKNSMYSKDDLNATIPSIAIIPLSQHIGAPAKCVVKVGDIVKEEDLIGESVGFVSANIHTPIPGEVIEIKDVYLPSGRVSPAVVIETKGEFTRLGKPLEVSSWEGLDKSELVDIIKRQGIVGLGGATFPTHVKLTLPEGVELEHLIINAAECEPYLSSDHVLMLEYSKEITTGLKILKKILDPKNIYVGMEVNKKDAGELLTNTFKEESLDASVVLLKNKYPQGAEKNLVRAIIGKEIPSGKLPLSVGVINLNVSTVYAIYEAVCLNRPLVERFVTIAGGAVKKPGVYRVRVGSTAKSLIEECGGLIEEPSKVIFGGPMMGFTVFDLDVPITKGTSGILALTKKEVNAAKTTNCLKCGRCVDGCPMGLLPSKLYKLIDHNKYDEALDEGLNDCVECGSCAYNCPAHLFLVQQFRSGKSIVRRSKGAK